MASKKPNKNDRHKADREPKPQPKNKDVDDVFDGDRDVLDEGDPMSFEVVEISPSNTDVPTDQGQEGNMAEDAPINFVINEENATEPAEEITRYAEDEGVKEEFQERQSYAQGAQELLDKMRESHSLSPEITGGDVDAEWDEGNESGDETVGASVPTPDQDIVDELGKGAGLTYRDDEPLDYGKIARRDKNRWELNPASTDEDEIARSRMLDDEYDEEAEDQILDEEDDDLELDLVSPLGVRGAGTTEESDPDEDEFDQESDDELDDDLDDDLIGFDDDELSDLDDEDLDD